MQNKNLLMLQNLLSETVRNMLYGYNFPFVSAACRAIAVTIIGAETDMANIEYILSMTDLVL